MHPETIEPKTKRVLDALVRSGIIESFYLAGGTALAIELGHRRSIDLDFFSSKDFQTTDMKETLAGIGNLIVVGEEDGTLHVTIDGVKVSFLRYTYPLLYPLVDFEGTALADERDIAAMKIDAISSRGSRKDFIDLFVLLEKYPPRELLGYFEKKFEGIGFNTLHILKSLVYFDDAETDPMPMMLRDIGWETVKETVVNMVMEFEREEEV